MFRRIDFSKVDKKLEISFKFFSILRFVWVIIFFVDIVVNRVNHIFSTLTWVTWYTIILAIYAILSIFVYRTQK